MHAITCQTAWKEWQSNKYTQSFTVEQVEFKV